MNSKCSLVFHIASKTFNYNWNYFIYYIFNKRFQFQEENKREEMGRERTGGGGMRWGKEKSITIPTSIISVRLNSLHFCGILSRHEPSRTFVINLVSIITQSNYVCRSYSIQLNLSWLSPSQRAQFEVNLSLKLPLSYTRMKKLKLQCTWET